MGLVSCICAVDNHMIIVCFHDLYEFVCLSVVVYLSCAIDPDIPESEYVFTFGLLCLKYFYTLATPICLHIILKKKYIIVW